MNIVTTVGINVGASESKRSFREEDRGMYIINGICSNSGMPRIKYIRHSGLPMKKEEEGV